MSLPININDLLRKQKIESNRIEFKKGWNPDTIYHTICAFANDLDNIGGGYILVGVEEENGQAKRPVTGIPIESLDRIQKEMIGFNNKIDPGYMPRIDVEEVDGKQVLIIWVPTGANRPYSVRERVTVNHSPCKWFVRCGTSSVEAKGEVMDELREMASRVPFDMRGNMEIAEDDIDVILLRAYLQNVKSRMVADLKSLDMMEILDRMDLLSGPTEQRMIKNVAAMMFCDHPEKFFPYTQISVVIFPEGKVQNPNSFTEKTFHGSVPVMIKETMRYLQSEILKEQVIKPKDRMESIRFFNYPYQALEEAVVNAMYHRDYQEYEEVEITVEPDRISILSFSGPDRSISAEAIKRCSVLRSRRCRNNKLGDFLKELELTEGRGTGIPTIQDELAKNGSPSACIDTDEGRSYFLIDIPVHEGFENAFVADDPKTSVNVSVNAGVNVSPHEYDILYFCKLPQSRRDIFAHIGVIYHSKNYSRFIEPLIEQNLLELTIPDKPKSPNQKFKLTDKGNKVLTSNKE